MFYLLALLNIYGASWCLQDRMGNDVLFIFVKTLETNSFLLQSKFLLIAGKRQTSITN